MNRRTASADRRRRPATKRTKRAQRTQTRAKRAEKAASKRAPATKRAANKASGTSKRRAEPAPLKRPRSQNRRKPAPKKEKAAQPRRRWREVLPAAGQAVRQWLAQRSGLLRRLGQVALMSVAVGALWWLGEQTVRYAHTAEAFAIREVLIEGNHRLAEIDVRRAAGLQIGSNAFEVSMEEARDRLLQHPWVRDATVVRRLPNRVRIQLVERKPVALVALDQLYLVSGEGAVFKRIGVDDPADLPVITGIASERFYDDFDYRKAVLLQSMALLQDYDGAGLSKREPVSEIHFDGARGVELFVGEDGMHLRLGTGHHRRKLRRFREVLTRLSREKARPAYVYLDNVRSPERVTVRLR